MTRLFIEGKEIDLDENVQFAITKQFEELSDPTIICNDWSKTVSIPFTNRNDEIFGHIYNPDKVIVASNNSLTGIYFDPLKKLDFRLEYDGNVLMTGYAKMNQIKQSKGRGSYEITLFGMLGKVLQEMSKITFDKTSPNTDYIIDGENYVSEFINKNLIYNSWSSSGQEHLLLYTKDSENYNVTDIIGFAPNNSFSIGFDYKNLQVSNDETKKIENYLESYQFEEKTGISADVVINNGLMPRGVGEYRSYYLLPFVYFNKLFLMFQNKAEQLTGYIFDLDDDWFNTDNPYWYNLVYMLKPFNNEKTESATNYYNPTFERLLPQEPRSYTGFEAPIKITDISNETFPFVTNPDVYPVNFNINGDYSILLNYSLGIELTEEGSSDPYSLRLDKDNALVIKVRLYNSTNDTLLKEVKYLICDEEFSGDTSDYLAQNVLRYGELRREGVYPNRKKYIIINPNMYFILQDYYSNNYTIKITSHWLNNFLRNSGGTLTVGKFMVKYTESDNYVKVIPNAYLQSSARSNISAQVYNGKRSNMRFSFNELWNNNKNLFSEILNYCKMFRISIQVDDENNIVKFELIKNIFKDYKIVNWTNKIDMNKDFIITPVLIDNKYLTFNYENSNIWLNTHYKEKFGVNYADYKLNTEYNFNNENKNLFKGLTTSITNTDNILTLVNLVRNKIIYIFSKEITVYNKDVDNKLVDIFGAYYFHNGLRNFDSDTDAGLNNPKISDDTELQTINNLYYYHELTDQMLYITTYPHLDILKDNNLCVFNIPSENYTYLNNYNNVESVYKNFWEKYMNERYNIQNKKITCYVLLSPIDFISFKFNLFVKIGNQLFMVNKIYDYDITNTGSVKADLISVQNISAYTSDNYGE